MDTVRTTALLVVSKIFKFRQLGTEIILYSHSKQQGLKKKFPLNIRFLIRSFTKAIQGEELSGSVKYLENTGRILANKFPIKDAKELLQFENQLTAFQWHTTNLCQVKSSKLS